jgi:hypothetical protein
LGQRCTPSSSESKTTTTAWLNYLNTNTEKHHSAQWTGLSGGILGFPLARFHPGDVVTQPQQVPIAELGALAAPRLAPLKFSLNTCPDRRQVLGFDVREQRTDDGVLGTGHLTSAAWANHA